MWQVRMQMAWWIRSYSHSSFNPQFPGSLVRLSWVGGHSLRNMNMVPVPVVRVHSMRVWWRTLVCSCWVLHHASPLDFHPLQHLVLVKSLYGGTHVMCKGLVLMGYVLWYRCCRTGEVVGGKGGGRCWWHRVARCVRGELGVKGVHRVRNNILSLWWGLWWEWGVSM